MAPVIDDSAKGGRGGGGRSCWAIRDVPAKILEPD